MVGALLLAIGGAGGYVLRKEGRDATQDANLTNVCADVTELREDVKEMDRVIDVLREVAAALEAHQQQIIHRITQ